MDTKVIKISSAMAAVEKVARSEIKTDDDKLLVAGALMAVTRNLYIETLGPEDTAHVFASVVASFDFMNQLIDQYKPTIH